MRFHKEIFVITKLYHVGSGLFHTKKSWQLGMTIAAQSTWQLGTTIAAEYLAILQCCLFLRSQGIMGGGLKEDFATIPQSISFV